MPVSSDLKQVINPFFLRVSPQTPTREVVLLMSQAREKKSNLSQKLTQKKTRSRIPTSSCVLIMEGKQLVGIFTEGDLVNLVAQGKNIDNTPVSEVMTKNIITLKQKDFKDIGTVLNLLRQHKISHLPIVNQQKNPMGIVTAEKILPILEQTVLQRESEKIALLENRNTELEIQEDSHSSQIRNTLERERLFVQVASQIRQFLNLEQILETTVREVRDFLKTDRVIIYQFSPVLAGEIVAESVGEKWTSILRLQIEDTYFQERRGNRYYQGQSWVVDNVEEVGLTDCHLELLKQFEVKANLVVPILVNNQEPEDSFSSSQVPPIKLWGLLVAHHCENYRNWQVSDVELLERLATQIAIAIQQATALEKARNELKERQRTEAQLRISEAKWRSLIENSPNLVMTLDQDGIILFAHWPQFDNIWNQSLIGTNFSDLIDLKFKEYRQSQLAKVFRGETICYESTWKKNLNLVTYFQIQIAPIWSNEKVTQALIVATDISDRKANEKALEKLNQELEARVETRSAELQTSEDRFRLVFEQSPIGIAIADLNGCLIRVNRRLSQITGYSTDELLGLNFMDITHPDDRQKELANIQKVLDENLEFASMEKRFINKSGKIIWVNVVGSILSNYSDNTFYILGMIEEIQTRKEAEEALKASERKFRGIFDSSFEFIGLFSLTGEIIEINETALSLGGVTYEQVVGNFIWESPLFHGLVMSKIQIQQAVYKASQGENCRLEIKLVGSDGSLIDLDISLKPLWHDNGKIYQLLAEGRDITAQKNIKNVLLESQRLVKSIVDNNPGIIYIINLEYLGVNYINRQIELIGYTSQDILEMGSDFFKTMIHANDLEQFMHHVIVKMSQGRDNEVYSIEYRIRQKDGSFRWFISRDTVFKRNTHAKVIEYIGIAEDISDRKDSEELLQRQFAAVEAAIDGIAILKDYQYTFLNKAHLNMFGYESPEEVMGKTWKIFYSPEEIDYFDQNVVPLLIEEKKWQGETIATRKDGSKFAQEVSLTMTDAGDFICVSRDITERKKTEEKLKQLVKELSDFKYALDQSSIVAITNPQGGITYVNDNFCKISGYSPEELIGNNHSLINSAYHSPEFFRNFWSTITRGKVWRGEMKNKAKEGTYYWVDATIVPFLNEQGKPIQYLAIRRDITDAKRAEEELQTANYQLTLANRELARANRLKEEFLANMSHELRTPLNAILGMSEGLLDDFLGMLNARQKKAVRSIQESGQHLLELINDILDLAKIESGKIELDNKPIIIPYLCESSLTFLKQQALNKNIQLQTLISDNIRYFVADERRVRQILINLLSNAVKFTPNGGVVTLEVRIEDKKKDDLNPQTPLDKEPIPPTPLEKGGKHLDKQGEGGLIYPSQEIIFAVKDTGIGIAPENLDRLFQSFVQIDSSLSRQYEGTGLGLALVRRLTELHGGNVTVESKINQGSCFTVRLPYVILSTDKSLTPSTLEGAPKGESFPSLPCPIPHPLILLAEDNQANIDSISDYLMSRDYRLVIARNGEEAIAIAKASKPHLILMDISMPGMDGLEATRLIRVDQELTNIPIIALTAFAMPGDREKCIAAGVNEYLTKPVRFKHLLNMIVQLLSQ
jgi:PAS domain S-box-containing protein